LTLNPFVPKQTPHLFNALCKATDYFAATGILQAMMIWLASYSGARQFSFFLFCAEKVIFHNDDNLN